MSATNEASATITDCVFAHNRGNGVVADAAAFATTRIQVDRSVMASDLGPGFFAVSAHSAGVIEATLVRNTVNRNHDDGILLGGTSPDGAGEGGSAAYSLGDNYFAGVVQPTGCYLLQSGN